MSTSLYATVFAVALLGSRERMKRSIWECFFLIIASSDLHSFVLLNLEKSHIIDFVFWFIFCVICLVTVLCITLSKTLILIRLNEISFPLKDLLFHFKDYIPSQLTSCRAGSICLSILFPNFLIFRSCPLKMLWLGSRCQLNSFLLLPSTFF